VTFSIDAVDYGAESEAFCQLVVGLVQLPLPPAATQAIARVHGAGAFAAPLPAWTRLVSGTDAAQQRVTITVPATLLLAGARAANGAIINIPGNALGAEINLEYMCCIYFS
jgi:hypothetical protein